MECPYCGSEDTTYLGVEEGGGESQSDLCDAYVCEDCGTSWDGDCIGIGEDEFSSIEYSDDARGGYTDYE